MSKNPNTDLNADISAKLNVLIAIAIKQLAGEKTFAVSTKRKQGAGELVRYLADMGLEAKDIAQIIGSPVTSVRTLLTPTRRK
jgi:DNA-directed RNA polymerase specialized sigma24 family protein